MCSGFLVRCPDCARRFVLLQKPVSMREQANGEKIRFFVLMETRGRPFGGKGQKTGIPCQSPAGSGKWGVLWALAFLFQGWPG